VNEVRAAHARATSGAPVAEPIRAGGLFETHLSVSDLGRSVAFYRDVVGLPLALEVPEREAAFFWIGDAGGSMLGLWSLGSAPIRLSLHLAFKATLADVLDACENLRSLGVTPLSFFATETTEPSVIAWMPAAAVYFRDPDGHLLEYLAMIDEPPRADLGILTWSEWDMITPDSARVHVECHTGPRRELRRLFEMAEDSASALDSYLDAGEVLVAVDDDRVVGHLQLVDLDHRQCEIKNMAVEPSHRGRGVGRCLIQAALERARAHHRSLVVVATAAADIDNLRFYQRAGFRMRSVERDAFTPASGYSPQTRVDGIDLRDRVWLDLELGDGPRGHAQDASSGRRLRLRADERCGTTCELLEDDVSAFSRSLRYADRCSQDERPPSSSRSRRFRK
jgi:predicted N-acetyltransferase YhbS/catechol 2,3-dioxygenase-like lactoylglutathione lyase family enzyme